MTGSCRHCRAVFKIGASNGTIHKHGPRSDPCPGSGELPEEHTAGTQQTIVNLATNSADKPSTQNAPPESRESQSPSSRPTLVHPKRHGPLIKRIPRTSRHGCATLLSSLLQNVIDNIDNIDNWNNLLNFGSYILGKPKRGGKKRNLSNLIGKRLAAFPQFLPFEDSVKTNSNHSKKSQNEPMKYLASAVAAKIEDGNIKAAVRILCSDDHPAKNSADTLRAINAKHPPSTLDADELKSPEELGCTPLQVQESDVREALSSFPCGSAGGPDGITAQHLRDLISPGIDNNLIINLTAFVNSILAGLTPASVTPILFGGSLIALEKKDGGIRPIAVGYVWRRLTAKCANHHVLESSAPMLAPTQLGVGVKGGAEAAIHATRRYLEDMTAGKLIAKLDFKNAFNSISRSQMLDAVATYAPEIYHLCYSAYAHSSFLSFGEHSILSAEGAQQGDPLGPFLFCITIQPILDKLQSELILGYLDDITIGGDVEQVAKDINLVVVEAEKMGLILNSSKCEIILPEGLSIPLNSAFTDFLFIKPSDAYLLGAPLLRGPSVDKALSSRHDDLSNAIARLQYIDAHDALLLLRNSLHLPRLLFTLRSSACHGNSILNDIDNTTRDGLSNILNLAFSENQWKQAGLPVKDGGLGIRSVAALASSAFLASAASTNELQLRILDRTSITEDRSKALALDSWILNTNEAHPIGAAAHKQKNWDRVGIEKIKDSLLSSCFSDQDRARILASRAKHSGDWLNALPISACGLRMDNVVIRAAVAFRLGCRLCEPHLCRCGTLVDSFGTHSLSCNRSAAAGRQLRHHLLNDIIWRSLSRANVYANKEPLGLYRTDAKRPDGVTLTPWQAGKCMLWDATSPDTLAASHVAKTSKQAGAAAECAANMKVDKYRELTTKYIFIPVAVETLGPINVDGENFLTNLGRRIEQVTMDKLETAYIFQRISVAVQRGNASSFAGCFEELLPSCD